MYLMASHSFTSDVDRLTAITDTCSGAACFSRRLSRVPASLRFVHFNERTLSARACFALVAMLIVLSIPVRLTYLKLSSSLIGLLKMLAQPYASRFVSTSHDRLSLCAMSYCLMMVPLMAAVACGPIRPKSLYMTLRRFIRLRRPQFSRPQVVCEDYVTLRWLTQGLPVPTDTN
jgi:hypothetical protein